MYYRSSFLLAVFFVTCFYSAQAQLYSYTNSTSGAYNSVAANTTGAALTRVNGATAPGSPCGSGFSSTSFSSTGTYSSSLQAVEADVTANAGYQLSVTGFSVGIRRSGTGPANARLAYSTDNGATWIDKGSNDAPNNASCGNMATATWTTSVSVPNPSSLKFRIYAFGASGTQGTFQIMNLTISGSVLTTDSIFSGGASFGPFCDNMNDTISMPFTVSGAMSGTYYVQMSDASGVFPSNATANIISTGGTSSPLTAVIPAGTLWGNGYLVRVVKQSPSFYGSGDNGSNITINHAVTPAIALSADHSSICAGDTIHFHIDSITNGGTSPAVFWYLNQNIISTDSAFSGSSFANGDSVYALLVSNVLCPTSDSVWGTHIDLTVYQPAFTSIFDTICPGGSVFFRGANQNTTGMYMDTLSTVHGCDSVVMLMLEVRNLHRDTMRVGICQGNSYTFGGQALTTAGTYNDTIRCDSIATLVLTYKTVQHTAITAAICPGSSYLFKGQNLSTAGTYSDTVRCDSIVTLTLGIKTVHNLSLSGHICQGSTYIFYGHSFSAAGTYRDTLSCDSIVTLTLTVTPLPAPAVTQHSSASHDTLMTSTYSSYQWYMNNQPINGATGSVYVTGPNTGYYTVMVTDSNGCRDSARAVYWRAPSGIESVGELSLKIYPNPANDVVNIETGGTIAIAHITLTDLLGRVVLAQEGSHRFTEQIDIANLPKGTYLLIIKDEKGNSTSGSLSIAGK